MNINEFFLRYYRIKILLKMKTITYCWTYIIIVAIFYLKFEFLDAFSKMYSVSLYNKEDGGINFLHVDFVVDMDDLAKMLSFLFFDSFGYLIMLVLFYCCFLVMETALDYLTEEDNQLRKFFEASLKVIFFIFISTFFFIILLLFLKMQ